MLTITVLFFVYGFCSAENRNMSAFVNPGCSDCPSDKKVLLHIVGDGLTDSLHHIWDFSYKPSFLLALTPLNTNLSINWTEFLQGGLGAVKFSSKPNYVFSFEIDKLVEYNDFNNSAVYEPSKYSDSNVTIYNAHNLVWRLHKFENSSTNIFAIMEGRQHHDHHKNKGVVKISLSAYGTEEHSDFQPHLLHTDNASQIDVVLDGFSVTKDFKSRFALLLNMISSDSADFSPEKTEWKSLDDEHSPGIFHVEGIMASKGYLQWRKVAYKTNERIMAKSTSVTSNIYNISDRSSLNHTVISSYFSTDLDSMLRKSVVISFGIPSDPADYSSTRYLSWTFLGSVGRPVPEDFSLFVKLTIILGIIVPVLIIIVCGAFIVVKRYSKRSQEIVFSGN